MIAFIVSIGIFILFTYGVYLGKDSGIIKVWVVTKGLDYENSAVVYVCYTKKDCEDWVELDQTTCRCTDEYVYIITNHVVEGD